jgi:hypothetical protein
MSNPWPGHDTMVTMLNAGWIKQWNFIIKQSNIEAWNWKKIIKKQLKKKDLNQFGLTR